MNTRRTPPPPLPPLDPPSIWDDTWQRLELGARSARHPFHLGVFATAIDGIPDLRTVVLRAVERGHQQLTFHTDRRSPKARGLIDGAPTSWLFYDAQARLQLRIQGTSTVRHEGEDVDQRWNASRPQSQACYRHQVGPGTALDAALDYAPATTTQGSGRDNFATVVTTVGVVDWLSLHHAGHRRLRFTISAAGVDSCWLAP